MPRWTESPRHFIHTVTHFASSPDRHGYMHLLFFVDVHLMYSLPLLFTCSFCIYIFLKLPQTPGGGVQFVYRDKLHTLTEKRGSCSLNCGLFGKAQS